MFLAAMIMGLLGVPFLPIVLIGVTTGAVIGSLSPQS